MAKKKDPWWIWLDSLDKSLRAKTGRGLISHAAKVLQSLSAISPPPPPPVQAELASQVKKKLLEPYAILGIPFDSPDWVVHLVYQHKAKELHPDKPGGSNEKMKQLNKAYEQIKLERGI